MGLVSGCSIYVGADRRSHPGTSHRLDRAAPIVDAVCTIAMASAAVYSERYERGEEAGCRGKEGEQQLCTGTIVFGLSALVCGGSATYGFLSFY